MGANASRIAQAGQPAHQTGSVFGDRGSGCPNSTQATYASSGLSRHLELMGANHCAKEHEILIIGITCQGSKSRSHTSALAHLYLQ